MFMVRIQINDKEIAKYGLLNVTEDYGGRYKKDWQTYQLWKGNKPTKKFLRCVYGDWKPLFNFINENL